MSQISLDQLSKKNQEFIRIATHQLVENGKSDEEIKAILEEIIPVILENQPKGITARGLYGAPTAWVNSLAQTEKEIEKNPPKNDDPRLMYLDSSLLLLGLIAAFNGLVSLTSKNQLAYGLTTLIVGSFIGGGFFYALYHFVYRHYDTSKGQRPPFLRTFLVIGLGSLLWLTAFSLTAFLPAIINPVLPSLFLLILGLATLAARWYLSKKLNIKSALNPGSH